MAQALILTLQGWGWGGVQSRDRQTFVSGQPVYIANSRPARATWWCLSHRKKKLKKNWGIGTRKHSCIKLPPSTSVLSQSLGTSAMQRHHGDSTSLFIVLKQFIFPLCLGATSSILLPAWLPVGMWVKSSGTGTQQRKLPFKIPGTPKASYFEI